MRAWMIQANPDKFDIDRYVVPGREIRWTARPKAEAAKIAVGDSVFFWRSAGHPPGFSGVVAIGEITRGVAEEEEDPAASSLWKEPPSERVMPRIRLKVSEVRLTPDKGMIEKSRMKDHALLRDMNIFKYAQRAFYGVSPQQTLALNDLWSASTPRFTSYPDESSKGEPLTEGAVTRISVNAYERNPTARAECLKIHGVQCAVCGFDFEAFYGNVAKGFIHVHHLSLISNAEGLRAVDPKLDLRPVCPNCHAVLHMQNPPFSIEELRALIHKPLR